MKIKTVQIIFIISTAIAFFCLGYFFPKNNLNKEIQYQHFIDIEEKNCINSSDVLNYPICIDKSIHSWDKEIQTKLKLLKDVLPEKDYEYIGESDKKHNEFIYASTQTINKFIMNQNGIIYQTEGKNNILQFKKQYALMLNDIYSTLKE